MAQLFEKSEVIKIKHADWSGAFMNISITNHEHEFKVGRFFLTVSNIDLFINDSTDNQRSVLCEELTSDEMRDLAKALYVGAKIREESQRLLEESVKEDIDLENLYGEEVDHV